MRPIRHVPLVLVLVLLVTETASAQLDRFLKRAREAVEEVQETVEKVREAADELDDGSTNTPPERATRAPASAVPAVVPGRIGSWRGGANLAPGPDDVIYRERFYKVYRGRGEDWCSSTAVFDLVYVPGGFGASTIAASNGRIGERYAAIRATRNAWCPEAQQVQLNVFAGTRDSIEAQYMYQYFRQMQGTGESAYLLQEWLDKEPEPPADGGPYAMFRDYKLREHLGKIYELLPASIDNTDLRISALFMLYVQALERVCAAELPENARTYQHMGYDYEGMKDTPFGQVELWQEVVEREVRMRPELYDPYTAAVGHTSLRTQALFLSYVREGAPDPVNGLAWIGGFLDAANEDMDRLLNEHGCSSPTTQRFERNAIRAFQNPPSAQRNALTIVDGVHTYPDATPDFSPPLPETGGAWINLNQKPRTRTALWRVHLTATIGAGSYIQTEIGEAQEQTVDEDITAAWSEGAHVLVCHYRNRVHRYWYRERPASADPARLRSRLSNHPLLLIQDPVDLCPAQGA